MTEKASLRFNINQDPVFKRRRRVAAGIAAAVLLGPVAVEKLSAESYRVPHGETLPTEEVTPVVAPAGAGAREIADSFRAEHDDLYALTEEILRQSNLDGQPGLQQGELIRIPNSEITDPQKLAELQNRQSGQ